MTDIIIIDVSHHQNPVLIDYDKLSNAIDGVIIRWGYGSKVDNYCDQHYNEFHGRGIPCGGYGFVTEYHSVVDQVSRAYDWVVNKDLKLGLWADFELENGADPLQKQTVHDYMQQAEARMGEFGIYTAKWCWNPIMNGAYYTNRKLWVANYTSFSSPVMPIGFTEWFLWQYKSTGRFPGYASDLDTNRFYGTRTQYDAWIDGEEVPVTEPLTKLYYPCDREYPITQYFGENPPYYPTSKGHNGIDLGTIPGTPIYCVADGIVEVAREDAVGYGRHIRIRHSHGITIYGHLSKMNVCVGDTVIGKQLIGLSGGSTDDPFSGYSTGPHLHFEYRWDKPAPQIPGGYVYNSVDPLHLFVMWDEQNEITYNQVLDDVISAIEKLKRVE